MNLAEFKQSIGKRTLQHIVFTAHAKLRMNERRILESTVREQLLNPESLELVEELPSGSGEEKYKLWFVPNKRIAYIHVIVLKKHGRGLIVVTAIKHRFDWQKKVEKYVG